jgi:hypothetical protein
MLEVVLKVILFVVGLSNTKSEMKTKTTEI